MLLITFRVCQFVYSLSVAATVFLESLEVYRLIAGSTADNFFCFSFWKILSCLYERCLQTNHETVCTAKWRFQKAALAFKEKKCNCITHGFYFISMSGVLGQVCNHRACWQLPQKLHASAIPDVSHPAGWSVRLPFGITTQKSRTSARKPRTIGEAGIKSCCA